MDFNQIELKRETIFKDAVLSAAEAKSVEIISAAQQESARQIAEAQAQCDLADHDAVAKGLELDVERERSAAVQMARKALLQHRTELVDALFAEVEEKLAAFAKGKDYPGWLVAKAKNCLVGSGDADAVVLLRGADLANAAALEKALPKAQVQQDDSIRLGGAKVRVGHVQYDLTLDAALAAEKESFTRTSGLTI